MTHKDIRELFERERAELAILSTYNFEPLFFEHCLLKTRSLSQARRIVVFVDQGEYQKTQSKYAQARLLNQRYLVVPIRRGSGVFHPKLSLLLGMNSASVICGSNNLSQSGCTHNVEIINAFEFAFDDTISVQENSHLISESLDFFGLCAELADSAVGNIVKEWLNGIAGDLPWLSTLPTETNIQERYHLLHTLDGDNIWSWLQRSVGSTSPTVFRVISPFYDSDLSLAKRIQRKWPKSVIEIVAQQHTSYLPVKMLSKLGDAIDLHELESSGSRRLHGKLCVIEQKDNAFIAAGSANFTTAAFDGKNVEVCLTWREAKADFNRLFRGEIRKRRIRPEDFEPGEELPPEERKAQSTNSTLSIYTAVLRANGMLELAFDPAARQQQNLAVSIYSSASDLPEFSLTCSASHTGQGQVCLSEGQLRNLTGSLRCTLSGRKDGANTEGPPAWIVQQDCLTFESSGSAGIHDKEHRIRETGQGLVEYLAELGEREGHAAIIEYLQRTNIRFHQEDTSGVSRPFRIQRKDPFRPDEAPAWLLLKNSDKLELQGAVLEFADRHEWSVLRRHARRGSLGGVPNFYDVLSANLKLLYRYYEHGIVDKSQLVGRACRYMEIFGLGFELHGDAVDGYICNLLVNMAGNLGLMRKTLVESNIVALVRICLLIAQRVRNELRRDSLGAHHPLEFAYDKFCKLLHASKLAQPARSELVIALEKVDGLTPDEVDRWLTDVRFSEI